MNNSVRPIAILGAGGHGRVIADIARAAGHPYSCFLDDDASTANGTPPILGPISLRLPDLLGTHRFIVGIGDAVIRRHWAEHILLVGGELATVVHPNAVIAPDVSLGCGTVIMAGAVVNTGTRIGRFAIVNTGAILDHDNTLEDNVQVAPGCTLAGRVTCRKDAFVGTGAIIIPKVTIGEGAYVAAGATVICDVRPRTLVAGCPAIEKKNL